MYSWQSDFQIYFGIAAGLFVLVLAIAKRKPSLVSLIPLALVELALVAQLIFSIFFVFGGARAKNDTVEYFAYLVVALMVPLGAAVWALLEKTRWSTYVLSVASFTVAVMVARMAQIWG